MKKTKIILSLLTFSLAIAQTPNSKYKIVQKIKVEGDGSWDCIRSEDETGRLFVSHETEVNVVVGKISRRIPAELYIYFIFNNKLNIIC